MTAMKTIEGLQNLALELDNASGGLDLEYDVLNDVKTNFLHLVEDMNNLEHAKKLNTYGDLRIRFEEWHRELRILSQLMYYSMEHARDHKQDIRYLSEGIMEVAREDEK